MTATINPTERPTYGDGVLSRIGDTVDDEYQEKIVHQTASLVLHYSSMTNVALATVLAWVLPGRLALLSLIVIIFNGISHALAGRWGRRHIVGCRPIRKTPGEKVLLYALVVAHQAAIAPVIAEMSGLSMIWAAVLCLIGTVYSFVLARGIDKLGERQLKRDKQRLEQQLDAAED